MAITPRTVLKKLLPIRRTDPGMVWENLARSAIVVSCVLVPILVLPWTDDGWEIHKVAALLAFTTLAWVFTLISIWRRHEHHWSWIRTDSMVLVFLLAIGFAAWLSIDPWFSLTGNQTAWSETVPVLVTLASWWFLFPQLFRDPRIRPMVWLGLGAGLVTALLFQVSQLSGFFLLPTFSNHPLFSLISQAPLDIAMIAALIGTATALAWIHQRERWARWLLSGGVALTWFVLLFLQQPVAWATFTVGMILVVVAESRRGVTPRSGVVVGVVLLAGLGLVAQFTNLPAQSSIQRPNEIRMDANSSWSTAMATLRHRPLLGTGPNTWYHAFVRYRPTEFNTNPWWNIRFLRAHNSWAQMLASVGIVGAVAWLAVLVWLGWRAWRRFATTGQANALLSVFILGITVVGGFVLMWSMVWWLIVWVTLAWGRIHMVQSNTRSQSIGPGLMVASAILAIGLVWFWIPASRYYFSAVRTGQAQSAISRTAPLTQVMAYLEQALRLNPRNLLAAELLGHAHATQAELKAQGTADETLLDDVRAALQAMQPTVSIRQGVDPAALETANNLLNRLSPFISDAESAAGSNFIALRKLEPSSPIHDVGYGQTLLVAFNRAQLSTDLSEEDRQQVNQLLIDAQSAFRSALQKKSDYVLARLGLAQTLNMLDQPNTALVELEKIGTEGQVIGMYWRERANAESKLSQSVTAVTDFERALTVDPLDVNTYLAFSQHYQRVGEPSKARDVLERGLKVLPDHPALKQALEGLGA